jgi:aldose 1-epimerase
MSKTLTLRTGELVLTLAPEIGGSIATFERSGIPILRGTPAPDTALEAGSFPLVPFSNRIREGRFTFRSREVRLTPNMPPDPSPLHGQGWQKPWQVENATGHEAVLVYRHEGGEWPWRYEARQTFALDESGLTLRLTCRNLSDSPMPCGLGQHPYFHCTPDTRLDATVTEVWTIDDDVLPVERLAAAGRYDLKDRHVCGQTLDNGFGGWGGSARITDPARPFAITLSSPDARFFQLYSPAEGGIFVAEPVSHANAALNEDETEWAALGLQILEPGAEAALTMRVAVEAA